MKQYYRLLSCFRLVECASALLVIVILHALCLPVYKVYVSNAYALNQAYVMVDVRTNLSIDSAYTGNAYGSNGYDYLLEDDSYVGEIDVSPQGHISAKLRLADYYNHTPSFVKKAIDGKTMTLYRNINTQNGYDFLTWRCASSPNEIPFRVIEPVPDSTLELKYFHLFCGG